MVNATVWLEQNYPENSTCTRVTDAENYGKNRSQIVNLDISNQGLDEILIFGYDFILLGCTDSTNKFSQLKKTNASYNNLVDYFCLPSNVKEFDFSHNRWNSNQHTIGYPNLAKFNFSHNGAKQIVFTSNPVLTHLDASNNLLPELNLTGSNSLVHLDANNNSLTKLDLNSPYLTYLDVSNNFLKELDLSVTTNLQTLNCSNNPNLASSTLTLPNHFYPSIVDCSNTALKNITFSNSSMFDCETGKLILGNNTATTTSTPTTVLTVTATSQPTNDLALNLGLGLGIPLAIIVVGLTAFFGYKFKKSRQAVPTAGSN
jgi:hypothetical protein